MIGAIIGDIAGSMYEFNNTKDYHFNFFPKGCNYTDDSIMSLAVADWAMHDPGLDPAQLVKALVRYGKSYPCPKGGYGSRFQQWLFNTPDGERHPYNSWGNGSAMRVSSIGWLYDDLEETERVAALSASVTHDHPEGIKGAQSVAAAIFMARKGASKDEIKSYISDRYGYDLDRTWEELHESYTWSPSCQGTVPEAITAFLKSSDFESALRYAVSLGGDSDTLACITGAVAEAYYKDIPFEMRQKALGLLDPLLSNIYREFRMRAPLRFTPSRISVLKPDEIFVFGSNLGGCHAGGAARIAMDHFGACWGVGVGRTGRTYAIPTMHGGVELIKPYVDGFIEYAREHPELKFLVTRIGCGIAGFRDEEIAPLFKNALAAENIVLPRSFHRVLVRS